MGLARLLLPGVVGQQMGLARLILPKRRLLRVWTLRRLLVLLRRSAGLLPLRDTVQHRLADGSGELRGGVLPKPHRLGSNNNSPAVALGCAVEAPRGGWRGCGRGSRCARWCARSARCPISPSTFLSISNCSTASATARRESPSPAPSSRSASTNLSSVIGPLVLQVEVVVNSTLADWPDGHLNSTAARHCAPIPKVRRERGR